ncbi:shikimate dehydrogenase [Paenibacillus athensensis]|uniref:Shikimate dehydrogenase (NADP(+)) n=1 Tax=Paenibacillus athensensis TaxID=1967502 RepID=A0A4Y8Q3R2_9BACL|nr:shikimate dehydrogenase [Paenibacillus athensensis]MCD1258441.1 shikimate dehydrogenase [Paenibacillus athensensis]
MTGLDSHTILYGVFGDPVRHSRSPLMLNRAFAEAGVNGAYAAFHVKPEGLSEAVAGIRALGFRGVNVTIPHKVEVMAHLDEIDEGARVIGAVNTIVNDGGKLTGYNTDGIGYARSLKEETGLSLRGCRVLLLGAGGAARGVAYALAKEGAASVCIANRTTSRADELAAAIAAFAPARGVALDEIAGLADDVDLVVNTTSAGMHPHVDELPADTSWVDGRHIASDLIYNPRTTRFLREAQERGARIHGGLGMFIYQGAYAFEYWTGLPAPVAAMRQVVEQSLTP